MNSSRTNTMTVKQLAAMAGVSARTLHYYDEIGLLAPSGYGENGYRYYGEADALRLQQVLFFRELGFSLEQIKSILDRPGFDLLRALQTHKTTLHERAERLERLIETVDQTIQHLTGEQTMANKSDMYKGFRGYDASKQKEYEQYIREQYGSEQVDISVKRWSALTDAEKKAYSERGDRLHQEIVANIDKGYQSPEIQALMGQYRQHLSFFYDVTLDIYEGLGHVYNQDPDFQAFYEKIHLGLAAFMEQAITYYVEQEREKK